MGIANGSAQSLQPTDVRVLPQNLEEKARPVSAQAADEGQKQHVLVLVYASAAAASALFEDAGPASQHLQFEGECEESAVLIIDKARAYGPDLIVADLDKAGARELLDALLSDPQTERIPIIGIGKFDKPEQAASFAALGVARVLPKPMSQVALRKACAELFALSEKRVVKSAALGTLSLEELSMRLGAEIQRGLCDAAGVKALTQKIDFGEGSEVLAAVWGAVARIRDISTIRSGGTLRFLELGPEGALPYAPWFGDKSGNARKGKHLPSRSDKAKELSGLKVVVVDDDPAIAWFLKDVLASAGALVHEAVDGEKALALAYQVEPDLVIADILMPGLDGFQLCRRLKRDVVLRDVPVILLSWKEDLLQRVRELGAQADGYLRKQSSAAAIVERVREVMAPRRRIVERLLAGDEVKGRLDGLMPRTLLGLVCSQRPNCVLSLRDATHLYEVEIREGKPVRATRTTMDGSFERGPRVFSAMLGVGAGRFSVGPLLNAEMSAQAPVRADLSGSLDEQMLVATASFRAAMKLLSGEALFTAERVVFDEDAEKQLRQVMPESARSVLGRLKSGASPKMLLQSGHVDGRFLEDVLCDAACHGAVLSVIDAEGNDLLAPAVAHEIDVKKGVTPKAQESLPIPILGLEALTGMPGTTEAAVAAAKEDPPPAQTADLGVLGSLSPPPARPHDGESSVSLELLASTKAPAVQPVPPKIEKALAAKPAKDTTPTPTRVRRPSQFAPHAAEMDVPPAQTPKPSRKSAIGTWLVFALTGVVFAVGARVSRERELRQMQMAAMTAPAQPVQAAQAVQAQNPVQDAPVPAVLAPEPKENKPEQPAPEPSAKPALNTETPEELPLPASEKVPAGQGLLEVVAGPHDSIYVDNKLIGSGPVAKVALPPRAGTYEIRVKLRGEERVRFATIKEGRLSRVRMAPPWSR